MKIEMYNWIYRIENGRIEIIPDKNSKKPEPEAFYKYYSLDKNSIDAITNNYVYASHPKQLNDIFDCYYRLLRFDDLDSIICLLRGVMQPEDIEKEWHNNKSILIQKVQFNYLDRAFIDLGIFSLTSDPTNILMWSYYSNNRGFVVQYDVGEIKKNGINSEIIEGPFQINYQNKISEIPFDKDEIALIFLYLTNIKSKKWLHENEWRMVFGRVNMYTPGVDIPDPERLIKNSRKFEIENKAVKRIVLGHDFFDQKEFDKRKGRIKLNSDSPELFFYKKVLLDYIIEKNIPSEIIGVNPGKFCLNTIEIDFQKTECDYQYTFGVTQIGIEC